MMASRTAPALALGAAVLFGLSTPAARLLVGTVDPWLLAGVLYLGSGGGLTLYRWSRHLFKRVHLEPPVNGTDLYRLGGAILFGGIIAPVLLTYGLAMGTASSLSHCSGGRYCRVARRSARALPESGLHTSCRRRGFRRPGGDRAGRRGTRDPPRRSRPPEIQTQGRCLSPATTTQSQDRDGASVAARRRLRARAAVQASRARDGPTR